MHTHTLFVLLTALILVTYTRGYSFSILTTPKHCENVTVIIEGTDGSPPYHVLFVPFGIEPLSSGAEVERVFDYRFDGNSISVPVVYPSNTDFLIVASDGNGLGSGGVSKIMTVGESDHDSCLDSDETKDPQPDFLFTVESTGEVQQCSLTQLAWSPLTVKGIPTFVCIIPGEDAFVISNGPSITLTPDSQGFDWIPQIQSGTTIIIGAGDQRGMDAGSYITFTVSEGPDASCLKSFPSSSSTTSCSASSTSQGDEPAGSAVSNGELLGKIFGGFFGGLVVAIPSVILAVIRSRTRRRKTSGFSVGQKEVTTQDVSGIAAPEQLHNQSLTIAGSTECNASIVLTAALDNSDNLDSSSASIV